MSVIHFGSSQQVGDERSDCLRALGIDQFDGGCADHRHVRLADEQVHIGAIADAKSDRQWQAGGLAAAGQIAVKAVIEGGLLAGDSTPGHAVDEARALGGHFAHALIRRGRREELDRRKPQLLAGRQVGLPLFRRQVGNDGAAKSDIPGPLEKGGLIVFEKDIVVGHEQKTDLGKRGRHILTKTKTLLDAGATVQALLTGLENHRAIGNGLGKGNLQFDAVHPVLGHLPDHLTIDRKGGIAEHQMGHQQDLLALQPLLQFVRQLHDCLAFYLVRA